MRGSHPDIPAAIAAPLDCAKRDHVHTKLVANDTMKSATQSRLTESSGRRYRKMMDGKKAHRPHDVLGEANANDALEAARNMPPGPERNEALKKAGLLRNAADACRLVFARRGRPPQ